MRAFRLHRHGEPGRLENVPTPIPAAGEVVIDMSIVGLNPLDAVISSGRLAPDAPLPRTLGVEGAGHLDGKPVLVHGGAIGIRRDGTIADQVVAPLQAVVPIPDGVALDVAACCGIVGATAVRLVELAAPQPGDRALVLAAAGSVGSAVCTLLASNGTRTFGQVRRDTARPIVKAAGAEPLMVATPEALAEALGGEKPNIVIDCLGSAWARAASDALVEDGRHVIFGTSAGHLSEFDLIKFYRRGLTFRGYRGVLEPPARLRQAVEMALAAVAEDRMRIQIGARFPFESTHKAFEHLRTEHTGKIVLHL